jgi:hypothetical protein
MIQYVIRWEKKIEDGVAVKELHVIFLCRQKGLENRKFRRSFRSGPEYRNRPESCVFCNLGAIRLTGAEVASSLNSSQLQNCC